KSLTTTFNGWSWVNARFNTLPTSESFTVVFLGLNWAIVYLETSPWSFIILPMWLDDLFFEFFCECSSLDRKSTRLNSSHVSISYAVFCLIKKSYNPNRFILVHDATFSATDNTDIGRVL